VLCELVKATGSRPNSSASVVTLQACLSVPCIFKYTVWILTAFYLQIKKKENLALHEFCSSSAIVIINEARSHAREYKTEKYFNTAVFAMP
jgi:hypothetical protein